MFLRWVFCIYSLINTSYFYNGRSRLLKGSSSNAAYFSSSPELPSPETKHYLVFVSFPQKRNVFILTSG